MLERKIVNELERWKMEAGKKALLLKGARQVGKTTSVREFAKRNYAHLVEINFEKFPTAKKAFDGNLDAETIISQLSIMGFGPFVEHKTLVFFDEIQTCPNARTAIKFLVEDGRVEEGWGVPRTTGNPIGKINPPLEWFKRRIVLFFNMLWFV